MSFLRNRTVIGVFCILLSVLICFGLTPLFNRVVSQKVEIVRVTQPVRAGEQITDDIDARYKAFADAETLLITNALVIPRGMSVPAYLATRLNYWEGQYASTGFSNKRLKGIHVLDHYVSMDEYEANRDAR